MKKKKGRLAFGMRVKRLLFSNFRDWRKEMPLSPIWISDRLMSVRGTGDNEIEEILRFILN